MYIFIICVCVSVYRQAAGTENSRISFESRRRVGSSYASSNHATGEHAKRIFSPIHPYRPGVVGTRRCRRSIVGNRRPARMQILYTRIDMCMYMCSIMCYLSFCLPIVPLFFVDNWRSNWLIVSFFSPVDRAFVLIVLWFGNDKKKKTTENNTNIIVYGFFSRLFLLSLFRCRFRWTRGMQKPNKKTNKPEIFV